MRFSSSFISSATLGIVFSFEPFWWVWSLSHYGFVICNSLQMNETETLRGLLGSVYSNLWSPYTYDQCVSATSVTFFTLYYFIWTFSCFYMIHVMSWIFLLRCHPCCWISSCFHNSLLSMAWTFLYNIGLLKGEAPWVIFPRIKWLRQRVCMLL